MKEGEEDDYYLHHNIDKSYGYPGVIYSQKRNALDYSDSVTVLYGHNMKDGSMFAGLHKYEASEYFDSHPDIYVYTKSKTLHYRIFASLYYDDSLIPAEYDDFKDKTSLMSFYKKSEELANHFDYGVEVTEDSKLLVLSTCEAASPQKRYLVEAVLIDER